jgi:hypothetical protein
VRCMIFVHVCGMDIQFLESGRSGFCKIGNIFECILLEYSNRNLGFVCVFI